MGCSGCSSGKGCSSGSLPNGCKNNGNCGTGGCNKLDVFDWLAGMELPSGKKPFNVVEVRFKNSRKEFFLNTSGLDLGTGDVVAVEASSGHDVGIVSLTGELVRIQMQKKGAPEPAELRKIYRKARQSDVDKWIEAQGLEKQTMITARKKVKELGLEMKVGDVEYQGDKTKATFYYIADGRVDFRELIKVLADEFKVRIEMKQIGARQEAGRIGGIGSCGRELCCTTWLTDFRTVSTNAARYQQLALNPVKLAGQCGKLKCCLNYELDTYAEALKEFPGKNKKLDTKKGKAFLLKTDIFKKMLWYVYEEDKGTMVPLKLERVNEIISMNAEGKKPNDLKDFVEIIPEPAVDFENVVGQDSLTRFDKKMKPKNKRRKGKGNRNRKKGKGGENRKKNNNRNRKKD